MTQLGRVQARGPYTALLVADDGAVIAQLHRKIGRHCSASTARYRDGSPGIRTIVAPDH